MEKITVEEGLVKYAAYIRSKAYRLARSNFHDMEDIVSTATIRALTNKDTWQNYPYQFKTWITFHILVGLRRYKIGRDLRGSEKGVDYIDIDDQFDLSVPSHQKDSEARVTCLKMPHPEVAMLSYLEYTKKEISEMMGINFGAVVRQATENRKFMREFYNELTRTS